VNQKLSALASQIFKRNIDAFLVTKSVDVSYLTSFPSSDSWLLVTPKHVFYITDDRYRHEVSKHVKDVVVYSLRQSTTDQVCMIIRENRFQRIGLDGRHISLNSFQAIQKKIKQIKWVLINSPVESLRAIKTKNEVSLVKKAIKINLECFEYLKRIVKPGLREKEVLYKLEGFLRSHKAYFSFPPIIASGPRSSFPHAQVTDRIIRRGEVLIADIGIEVGGYKSDLTRMFFLGKIPRFIREAYDILRETQRVAISSIRPGVRASEVDQQARNFLKKKNLDQFFIHSLGHGVGLEVHERPTVSARSTEVLEKGMIFTIEPGLYFPHQFGMRVEDMVLVISQGCDVLSQEKTFLN
jgi:Xaa-Pro aminopeptidase